MRLCEFFNGLLVFIMSLEEKEPLAIPVLRLKQALTAYLNALEQVAKEIGSRTPASSLSQGFGEELLNRLASFRDRTCPTMWVYNLLLGRFVFKELTYICSEVQLTIIHLQNKTNPRLSDSLQDQLDHLGKVFVALQRFQLHPCVEQTLLHMEQFSHLAGKHLLRKVARKAGREITEGHIAEAARRMEFIREELAREEARGNPGFEKAEVFDRMMNILFANDRPEDVLGECPRKQIAIVGDLNPVSLQEIWKEPEGCTIIVGYSKYLWGKIVCFFKQWATRPLISDINDFESMEDVSEDEGDHTEPPEGQFNDLRRIAEADTLRKMREVANQLGDIILKSRDPATEDTLLHVAASKGCYNMCEFLIDRQESLLGDQDMHGCTPLHRAVLSGQKEVAALLLRHGTGAKVNAQNMAGKTALHMAQDNADCEMGMLLLNNGANPNIQETENGYTPLHSAAWCNDIQFATILVEHPSTKVGMRSEKGPGHAPRDLVEEDCREMYRLLTGRMTTWERIRN